MSTISDAVIEDHQEMEEYYNEVINSKDPDHQQRYGNQFIWELARHAVAEELVVYPAMEKLLGAEGKKKADEDRAEHHKAKARLQQFQNLSSTDPRYLELIKEIWADLKDHNRNEEINDLPPLEAALKSHSGESEALAKSFERTKKFVPTKAHPIAGEKPPFETVFGFLAAPIDKLGDLFRKFPEKSED